MLLFSMDALSSLIITMVTLWHTTATFSISRNLMKRMSKMLQPMIYWMAKWCCSGVVLTEVIPQKHLVMNYEPASSSYMQKGFDDIYCAPWASVAVLDLTLFGLPVAMVSDWFYLSLFNLCHSIVSSWFLGLSHSIFHNDFYLAFIIYFYPKVLFYACSRLPTSLGKSANWEHYKQAWLI